LALAPPEAVLPADPPPPESLPQAALPSTKAAAAITGSTRRFMPELIVVPSQWVAFM
jgi:hypothetical protein